ncbi:MAG: ornithine carbamoyltransferase [Actinomycetaceae bacterium]|nr:ornithine carbamoyltransferase [Actinomycetaceae bacterium]
MKHELYGRHFLKELDFTPEEWLSLLDLSEELKAAKKNGTEEQHLKGKNIALIFEKTSTRTRCSFEVAAYDQGAKITYLDPVSSQMGHKESVEDTARVLGRYYDGIEFRGKAQAHVETLAELSGVPVWNGLTDDWHPTQMLCDALTMKEHSGKPYNEISFAYLGDGRNNISNSLMIMGVMLGMDVRIVGPESLWNEQRWIDKAKEIAAKTGGKITHTSDPKEGVKGVDFLYADVWVSMGEPKEVWDERIALLKDYQVNQELMDATGNPNAKFLHCLPAFHDRNTVVGEDIYEKTGLESMEVTNDVFESEASVVFDQAENRMHTIKAVMVATLGE